MTKQETRDEPTIGWVSRGFPSPKWERPGVSVNRVETKKVDYFIIRGFWNNQKTPTVSPGMVICVPVFPRRGV